MLTKFVEGKNTSWVVDLKRQVDDYPLYMDATPIVKNAIKRDIERGYPAERGPYFVIEQRKIDEYVDYALEFLNRENFYKFDTRYYRFFLGSVPVRKPHSNASTGE